MSDEMKGKETMISDEIKNQETTMPEEIKNQETTMSDEIKDKDITVAEEIKNKGITMADEMKGKETTMSDEMKDNETAMSDGIKVGETTMSDGIKDKEITMFDEIKDKEITMFDGIEDKETTTSDEIKDKETTLSDETKANQNAWDRMISDEVKNKETTMSDEIKDKETTLSDETKDKETTMSDEIKDKGRNRTIIEFNQIAWNKMFELLKNYKRREGNCRVSCNHVEDGKNLGKWLITQRVQNKKGDIDGCRRILLEHIGVVWDVHSEQWESSYRNLAKFHQREGHSDVPGSHIEDGMKLGEWLIRQRNQKRKRKIDKVLEQWESSYRNLAKFHQREGHSDVPGSHIEDGMKLGEWLIRQRNQKRKRKIDKVLEQRLEDVGVVWNVLSEQWESHYRLLLEFRQREGHSNVPSRHIEDGRTLGRWLNHQRQQKKKGKLDESIIKRLEDAEVIWDVLSEQWESNYRILLKFRQRKGHSNAPATHIEDDTKLGAWLNNQRNQKKKGKLDGSLVKRLEDTGVVWDVISDQWESNYRLLVNFQQREGHSNVPATHIENDMKLGQWLNSQRRQKRKGKIDLGIKKRLDDIGVVWDVLSEQWENNFHLLLRFQLREGHSNVPRSHIEEGIKLGEWLKAQRQQKKKEKINKGHERRLEDVGVVWETHLENRVDDCCLLIKF
eukprot:CAMPEP_0194161376 /NCGR_PEP_ID=MMETSP0152-20130528/78903_1 /TAXON_ID=1049557 /ORGANISM="Thalassiothrix antarctica, Strain L6-D1" /LENGTH=673 /DNA_ID=CAMNT_0038871155 /DNA_START=132 /DNA_END=2153 /DNA_ORIENTATION=+